jgi:hypothetical protein
VAICCVVALQWRQLSHYYALRASEIICLVSPIALMLGAVLTRGRARVALLVMLAISLTMLVLGLNFDALENRWLPRDSADWFGPIELAAFGIVAWIAWAIR